MLEILDLAKRYGAVTALDGASFAATPGRIVGFLGPNGAGKTTTMRCIFGLAQPDRGEVRWAGTPVDRDTRLRFGYMPEQRGLYPRMRVGEQVSYFAQQHGLSGRDAGAATTRWLERMGLGDRAKSKLEELSHGNQQRIQLAVALVHDPELLVLDEPFSGLDPIGIATMTEVVKERAAAGCAVLGLRFEKDLATGTRFETLTREIGDAFIKVELPGRQHSTLTEHRRQEAVDAVLEFFGEKLRV
jgi:ABC-2 type transport system ATP-binding protein